MKIWQNNNFDVSYNEFCDLLHKREYVSNYYEGLGKYMTRKNGGDWLNNFKDENWEYSKVGLVVKQKRENFWFWHSLNYLHLKWFIFKRGFFHSDTIGYKTHRWFQNNSNFYLKWWCIKNYGRNLGKILYQVSKKK